MKKTIRALCAVSIVLAVTALVLLPSAWGEVLMWASLLALIVAFNFGLLRFEFERKDREHVAQCRARLDGTIAALTATSDAQTHTQTDR